MINSLTPMRKKNYLIMSSVGRSGSTALRKALGEHPDIYSNGRENNQIQDIVACGWKNKTMTSRQRSMVVSESVYDQQYAELIHRLTWPSQLKRLRSRTLMCAVNTEPEYSDYLFDLLPGGKMLYLIRDGIEVICSRQKFPGFQHYDFNAHCEVWMQSVDMVQWAEQRKQQVCLFRYEWMLKPDRLETELGKLFGFVGLRDRPEVLQHILSHRYHPTSGGPKGDDWANVSEQQRTAIAKKGTGGWQQWTEAQQRIFEDICGDGMKKLGYAIPWQAENSKTMVVAEQT